MNPYLPTVAEITKIRALAPEVRGLTLKPGRAFNPGQFLEVSVLGVGEATFVPCSAPSNKESLEIVVRKVGRVTTALHNKREGEILGIRGPLGNGFPLEELSGRDLILVAGGLGIVPLRPLLLFSLERRNKFGKISLFYGAKTPKEFLFQEEISLWEKVASIYQSVDLPDKNWSCDVGMVTAPLKKAELPRSRKAAILCGPPIMCRSVIEILNKKGFKNSEIYLSLERKMHCGIGKCQHCVVGKSYVCQDGPVFRYDELLNQGVIL